MTNQQFEIVSADLAESFMGGYSDFFEVNIRMGDKFEQAVTSGQLPIILIDNPHEIHIDDELPAAINAKKIAHSIHGYDGFYDLDSNVFTIYIASACMGRNLSHHPMAEFEKAVTELLKNPNSAPKPPRLG